MADEDLFSDDAFSPIPERRTTSGTVVPPVFPPVPPKLTGEEENQ